MRSFFVPWRSENPSALKSILERFEKNMFDETGGFIIQSPANLRCIENSFLRVGRRAHAENEPLNQALVNLLKIKERESLSNINAFEK